MQLYADLQRLFAPVRSRVPAVTAGDRLSWRSARLRWPLVGRVHEDGVEIRSAWPIEEITRID